MANESFLKGFNESTRSTTGYSVLGLALGGLLIYGAFALGSHYIASTRADVATVLAA